MKNTCKSYSLKWINCEKSKVKNKDFKWKKIGYDWDMVVCLIKVQTNRTNQIINLFFVFVIFFGNKTFNLVNGKHQYQEPKLNVNKRGKLI